MSIAAGSLNRTIQIQQQSAVQDSYGQPIATWTTVWNGRASIDVQRSALIYATAEFISKVTYRINLRWMRTPIIAPSMRVVYLNPSTGITHIYNIETILNEQEGNRQLTLLCYELDGYA